MPTPNDDNDYSIEIDSEVYSKDYDDVYPGEQEIKQEETDIQFE